MSMLGDISAELHDAILALNNAHVTELSPLNVVELRALLDGAFYARRVGDLDGFLIALDETHPTYASPNYLWFRARKSRFVYVDRIVVTNAARGMGYARLLYADLIGRASTAGHKSIVCEVNLDPPNPASNAFHDALGFKQVGTGTIHGGSKTVRYLELTL
jgi:predicted GNAT superfamily acetyltransferase